VARYRRSSSGWVCAASTTHAATRRCRSWAANAANGRRRSRSGVRGADAPERFDRRRPCTAASVPSYSEARRHRDQFRRGGLETRSATAPSASRRSSRPAGPGAAVTYSTRHDGPLATTASKQAEGPADFFPLTVDVGGAQYAAADSRLVFRREARVDDAISPAASPTPAAPSFARACATRSNRLDDLSRCTPTHLYDVVAINGAAAACCSPACGLRPGGRRSGRLIDGTGPVPTTAS